MKDFRKKWRISDKSGGFQEKMDDFRRKWRISGKKWRISEKKERISKKNRKFQDKNRGFLKWIWKIVFLEWCLKSECFKVFF